MSRALLRRIAVIEEESSEFRIPSSSREIRIWPFWIIKLYNINEINRDNQRRDQGRDRDHGDRGRGRYHRRDDKGRDRDRVHFANEGSDGDKSTGTAEDPGESDNSAEEDAEVESALIVLDRHLTYYKCYENFKST